MNEYTKSCKSCKHYQETEIFELCTHKKAEYSIEGKKDQHTIFHMREHSHCGQKQSLKA